MDASNSAREEVHKETAVSFARFIGMDNSSHELLFLGKQQAMVNLVSKVVQRSKVLSYYYAVDMRIFLNKQKLGF